MYEMVKKHQFWTGRKAHADSKLCKIGYILPCSRLTLFYEDIQGFLQLGIINNARVPGVPLMHHEEDKRDQPK